MKPVKTLFIIIFIFTCAALTGAGSMVYVERIEFKGVKNSDKYGIVRSAKAKASGKGIYIDIDSLKDVLNGSVIIENYDIAMENNTMTVTVDEKYPLFMMLLVEKNISIPSLVDENGNVLDSGRFFRTDMPIIISDRVFFENEKNGVFVKGLFENLRQIARDNNDFSGELSEIEVYSGNGLRVKLRGRKTEFFIKNDLSGFTAVEKSAAYLDSVNSYPDVLDLKDTRALIR